MQPEPDTAASNHLPLRTLAAIAILFAITVLCYWPSLDGPFIFDDIPNLEELGSHGGLDSLAATMEFVTSGQSGPLGRPLSLATFALNGQDWPTDPLPFRITNLLIQLVNGLLVFLLARSLLGTLHDDATATRLGLLCMALWLLHPLLASTTAYVIQRMTQLASLFILAGLLCYVRGRRMLPDMPRNGWIWIVVGMGTFGTLAVLSKETGALLPLYALVIELTLFRTTRLPAGQRRGLVALLSAPVILVGVYMAVRWEALATGFEFRPFSMSERLLTQPVVLVKYLQQVFVPQMSGLGIIHDDFPISTSLLQPPATLLSLALIAALVGFAIWVRKKQPIVALGILWFFAGHSLEAGPLSLEIYFDHRNYLPLFGPLLAVCSLLPSLPAQLKRVAPVVIVLFLCFEVFMTYQSAKLWGNEDLMMQVALIDHPGSLRAQQHAANRQVIAGRYEQALDVQLGIAERFPDHTATRLGILNLRCLTGTLTPEHVDATQAFLQRGAHDQQVIGYFMPLLNNAAGERCPAFDLDDYRETLDALLRNPVIGKDGKMLGAVSYFKGLAFERQGQLDAALEQLDQSYDAVPDLNVRLQQVVWLLENGRPDEAERYLDLAREHLAAGLFTRNLRQPDMQLLQQQINAARRTSN